MIILLLVYACLQIFIMPKRKEYFLDLNEAALHALSRGKSQLSAAKEFNLSQQIVKVWLKKSQTFGIVKDQARSGRPRKTLQREDRIIKMMSLSDSRKSARTIRDELESNYGKKLHVSTVKRRLASAGLNGRRPSRRKPLISEKNRKDRFDFSKNYQHWTSENWKKFCRAMKANIIYSSLL